MAEQSLCKREVGGSTPLSGSMDKKTIDTYNELAQEYDDETKDFWERFPRSILDNFIKLAKGSVLDVGSRPGRDGLILQQHGLSVTCIDASEAMVKLFFREGAHVHLR